MRGSLVGFVFYFSFQFSFEIVIFIVHMAFLKEKEWVLQCASRDDFFNGPNKTETEILKFALKSPCCSLMKLTFLSVSLLIVAVKSTRMSISRKSHMGLTRSVALGQLLCGLCNYWPGPPISEFTSVVRVWTLQLGARVIMAFWFQHAAYESDPWLELELL